MATLRVLASTVVLSLIASGCGVEAPEEAPREPDDETVATASSEIPALPGSCSVGGNADIWGCCGSSSSWFNANGCALCSDLCYAHDVACMRCSWTICGPDCRPDFMVAPGEPETIADHFEEIGASGCDIFTEEVASTTLGEAPTASEAGRGVCTWTATADPSRQAGVMVLSLDPAYREEMVSYLNPEYGIFASVPGVGEQAFLGETESGLTLIAFSGHYYVTVLSQGLSQDALTLTMSGIVANLPK